MFYMVVEGDEAEAQRRATEGFEMVLLLWTRLMEWTRAEQCVKQAGGRSVVDFYWDDHSGRNGIRVTWDIHNNRFMVHHGEEMWESSNGLRIHLDKMGFYLWDDMSMADGNENEQELMRSMVETQEGKCIQRPMYLSEPVCLLAEDSAIGKILGYAIWRVGSVVREEDI